MHYRTARLIANERLRSGYFVLRLGGCQGLESASAGQFIMLRGDWGCDPLLPRAFSLLRTHASGEIEVLGKTVGKASALLEVSPAGAILFVLGPLGVGYPAPETGRRDLLVAGGVGLAPLLFYAERYRSPAAEFYYGARSSDDLVLLQDVERTGAAVHVATEDGSAGTRGYVTRLLETRLDALGKAPTRILACGPNAMLDAVRKVAQARDLPCYLSLEGEMACGIGACLGCAVAGVKKPYLYVCKDGPVFRTDDPRMKPDLRIAFAGIEHATPIVAASGTFGYGQEFAELTDLSALGGIVTKGISPEPRAGNPSPRMCETPAGMIDSIGLENVGVDGFAHTKLPFLRRAGTRVWANFFGETFDEYVDCAGRLGALEGVDMLEMNVSCPNIEKGGVEFGVDPAVLRDLVRACRQATQRPLVVKLTPNVTDVVAIARAAVEGGADALSLINTFTAMGIDARKRRPRIATLFGGLSGPAIKPLALRMVFQVARAGLGVPISGIGGVRTGEDAAEFMLAGATTVQVGTQSFVDPDAAARVGRELAAFCEVQGIGNVRELVGALELT